MCHSNKNIKTRTNLRRAVENSGHRRDGSSQWTGRRVLIAMGRMEIFFYLGIGFGNERDEMEETEKKEMVMW